MIKIVLLAGVVFVVPALAHAKTFKISDESPVTSIMIPDSWEPEEIDSGVEGTSPDKETYVAAEVVAGKDLDAAGEAEDKFFADQKIKLDGASKVEKKTTVNGLPAYDVSWKATDEDGPTHIGMTLVKVSDDKLLMLTYWGTAAGETSNKADLIAIAKSITPIK